MKKTDSSLSLVLGQVREQLRRVGSTERSTEHREATESDGETADTESDASETGDGSVEPRDPVGGTTGVPREEVERLRRNGRDTDAEIVELVAESGGKIPQKRIVEGVALSESTVSRRLTDMERSGLVERLTVGRENLVYLPGTLPTDAGD